MRPKFREDKAAQAAACLLTWAGRRMNYMVLIKLLYLADRVALLKWGRPITYARGVSMKHGPVLSEVLDLISEGGPPGQPSIWGTAVSAPCNYEVTLTSDLPLDDLSEVEVSALRQVFDEYGHMNRWDLVKLLHDILPEWVQTESSITIATRDILLKEGRTEAATVEIEQELEELAIMDRLLAA